MESHPIVTAAYELQPLIRQHLVEGENRARLTKEVVSAAGRTGLFRLYAPREVGGLEVPPPVALAATEAVSAADPAVGWYISNSMPACVAAASLPESARAELFAEPDLNFGFAGPPLGRAVPVDGGYRVSGRWPVVTGCDDAKWCALAGLVMDGDVPRQVGGQPDGRLFLIPTAAMDISPTWKKAAAMRGTDSNAASVREVFVPEVFAHTPAKPRVIDRPLFRLSLPLLVVLTPAAVALGVLGAALESAAAALGSKTSSFSGKALRDQEPIQEFVADCHAAHRAARAGLIEATNAVWEVARSGAAVPMKQRAEFYASCFYAADTSRETISRLYAGGTSAGFLQGDPIERALRNLHAIAFAVETSNSGIHRSAGRVLMGGEPLEPMF